MATRPRSPWYLCWFAGCLFHSCSGLCVHLLGDWQRNWKHIAQAKAIYGFFEEFLQCFELACEDLDPAVCAAQSCDADFAPKEWRAAFAASGGPVGASGGPVGANTDTFWEKFGFFPVRRLCASTCQSCGRHTHRAWPAPCEPGWSHADGACFKYDYRRPLETRQHALATWSEAESSCQAEGAHLATIETLIQEHLVFQLVSQRPEELGPLGLWAWVGLWIAPAGCSQTSNWTWIGANHSVVDPRLVAGAQCECGTGPACTPNGFYTHHASRGQTMTLSAAPFWRRKRAWVCSKKAAMLATIRQGSCQAAGLLPITDQAMCEEASSVLLGMRRFARMRDDAALPFGCSLARDARHGVSVSNHPDGRRVDVVPGSRTLLCRHPNASAEAASSTSSAPEYTTSAKAWRRFSQPLDRKAGAALSPPVAAVVLLLALLPAVAFLAVLGRRALLALDWAALVALRPSDFLSAGSGDKVFDAVVRQRLRGLRDTTAKVAAVLIVCFHLAELFRTVLLEEAVCVDGSSTARLREWLAVVHVANVWAAAALFALHRCRACVGSSAPRVAFLLANAALDLAEHALLGEQVLLVESRLYRQLLWRLLVGACAPPVLALGGNALISAGMCAIYWARIPNGMIFTVGSTRSGLLASQGCNSMWPADTATQMVTLVTFTSNFFDKVTGSTLKSAATIVDDALKRQTDFLEFLLSEAVLFAIVAACLLLLHFGLFKAISQSLRLQSSADQLAAVSQILGTLCDATFLLDGDYCVAAPAPTLDVLLHLAVSPQGMVGQDFRDCVATPEDRADLEEALKRDASSRVLGGEPMYLDLRAAGSAQVRVQFLCAQFADNVGARRLICGVSEIHSDNASMGPAAGRGPSVRPSTPKKRKRCPGLGTPAERSNSGSLCDSGGGSEGGGGRSPRSSESCSAGRRRQAAAVRTKDVSQKDFRLEIEGDKVHFASHPVQEFLGVVIARGAPLTAVSPQPAELLDAVRSCAEGDELRIVLNRFWGSPSDGGTKVQPHEFVLRVEAATANVNPSGLTPSSPTLRLHVLSTKSLGDWQPVTHKTRGVPTELEPSVAPANAAPPTLVGKSSMAV